MFLWWTSRWQAPWLRGIKSSAAESAQMLSMLHAASAHESRVDAHMAQASGARAGQGTHQSQDQLEKDSRHRARLSSSAQAHASRLLFRPSPHPIRLISASVTPGLHRVHGERRHRSWHRPTDCLLAGQFVDHQHHRCLATLHVAGIYRKHELQELVAEFNSSGQTLGSSSPTSQSPPSCLKPTRNHEG